MAPNQPIPRRGILFVVSAPSGAGKTTLCNALRQTPDFVYSVSCTTRGPRAGEIEGEDYYFLSQEEFARRVEAGEFLEHATVHGYHYGTLRSTVLKHLNDGVDVLLDIDIQGAAAIRACTDPQIIDALADAFIMPPSLDELHHRLLKRASETPEQMDVRLRNAAREIKSWRLYKYSIISGSVEEDLQKFRAIMRAERYLSRRLLLDP
jgi:guanylate kinase